MTESNRTLRESRNKVSMKKKLYLVAPINVLCDTGGGRGSGDQKVTFLRAAYRVTFFYNPE